MRRPLRTEQGAVAVLVALLSIVLFAVAALAVDLSNAFVRKRDAQAQADFAALAAGQELGSETSGAVPPDAVQAVLDYFNENQPQDDRSPSLSLSLGQLTDGSDSNGEVKFANGGLQVVTPPAQVDFSFARVISNQSSLEVAASATVRLRSPGSVPPLFIPADCAEGTVDIKASNYNPNAPTFDPASSNGGSVAKLDTTDPLTVDGGVPTTVTLFGERFATGMSVDFFHEASGDRVPVDTSQSIATTSVVLDAAGDEATVELPPKVYNVPGTWYIRVDNGNGYSKDSVTIVVGSPTAPPEGCGVKSTGDFGYLDSPRKLVTQLADAGALNLAEGLDHALEPFGSALPPRVTDSCNGNGGTPYPGAVLDNVSQDGNNCVAVKTGMNTDVVTDGLIVGGTTSEGAFEGRLAKTLTLPNCDRNGGTDSPDRLGVPTNDDVLSCFLASGVSVGDITAASLSSTAEKSISSRIFDSPRFMVVPVIDYGVNPQNGYYPIKGFAPVFITDEGVASTKGNSYATSTNGVIIQQSKVVGMRVVVINPDALPEAASASSSASTIPYLGFGTRIIQLID